MNDRPLLERPLGDFLGRTSVQVVIVAALAIAWFFRDLDRPLTGDAIRYASITRTMVETGQWARPILLGEPYFRKPPLGFWAGAVSMKLFRITSRAAMMPSTVAAIALIVAVYLLVARAAGPLVGLLAAGLLTFTPDFFRNSVTFRLESMLLLFTTLAVAAVERARTRPAWFVAFWALLGAAVLTKSAAGITPIPVLLATALILRDPFPFNRLAFWAAAPVFLLVAGPWYAHMTAYYGREFWASHVGHQAIDRFGGPRFAGFKFLLSCFLYPGACLFLAPLGVYYGLRDGRKDPALRRLVVLGAVWVVGTFLALQTLRSGAERERYMYFTLSAAAGLAGYGAAAVVKRWATAAHIAGLAAVIATALFVLQQVAEPLFERERSESLRDLVHAVELFVPEGPIPVVVSREERVGSFVHFYFGRAADVVPTERAAERFARPGREAVVVADEAGLAALAFARMEVLSDAKTYTLVRLRMPAAPVPPAPRAPEQSPPPGG